MRKGTNIFTIYERSLVIYDFVPDPYEYRYSVVSRTTTN
jgi:hypothetical protein